MHNGVQLINFVEVTELKKKYNQYFCPNSGFQANDPSNREAKTSLQTTTLRRDHTVEYTRPRYQF